MTDNDTISRQIQALSKKVDTLINQTNKKTWVKVSAIMEITGWNREKMRQMRDNGVIRFRKGDNGMQYLLESVPDIFKIKKTA